MFADLIEAGAIPLGCTLEVGCGTGTNAIYLAQHGFEVVGVDISPLGRECARKRRVPIRLRPRLLSDVRCRRDRRQISSSRLCLLEMACARPNT
jgi:SAM-dependent methyltransferase